MSIIVINPNNGHEIIYTEEETPGYVLNPVNGIERSKTLLNARRKPERPGEINNRAPQVGSTDSNSSSDVPKSALT